jgi:predicted GIY-YIG superfamily endonuclease
LVERFASKHKSKWTRRSYIGYTVNLHHRLRQHRGELAGGAVWTHSFNGVDLVAVVTGFDAGDKSRAESYEWHAKHAKIGKCSERDPTTASFKKAASAAHRRLFGFTQTRTHHKFNTMPLTVWVAKHAPLPAFTQPSRDIMRFRSEREMFEILGDFTDSGKK